jgi:predicted GNAT family N-acyltransferase
LFYYFSQDHICEHFVASCDKKNEDGTIERIDVGTIRLWPKPESVAKLGRLCVLSSARGLYIGQKLVKAFIDYCKENGFHSIFMHSQYPKKGFYENLGFVVEEGDEIFDEAGTPHIRMWMRNL